jgi:NADPH:quinone reductase-like Zn-dependent oxidoreductase
MITTDAWLINRGAPGESKPAELKREAFSFPDILEYEVLAEPIYGCWEANMTHSLERNPIDICRWRHEEKVVVGNAGVLRILKTGPSVTTVKEGDLGILAPLGTWDELGFMVKVYGYDAPKTIGLLAKKVKLHEKQVYPLPKDSKHTPQQWAAFSVRYASAWTNWKVAYGCWRQQMTREDCPTPFVWGWGGGVSLAELTLAKFYGCRVAMIASNDQRLALIRDLGMQPIDRREFIDLNFDERQYESEREYKKRYLSAEKSFLYKVRELTGGSGVSIFIDNVGAGVYRATLRALGPQGVIATCGWRSGMTMTYNRAVECMKRHIHVHTHGGKYSEGVAALHFAEETGWVPPVDGNVYSWEEIPLLAQAVSEGKIRNYFPIFQVNNL